MLERITTAPMRVSKVEKYAEPGVAKRAREGRADGMAVSTPIRKVLVKVVRQELSRVEARISHFPLY
ncbi:hypothetical protein GCM10027417_21570 [Glutamicibacter endophyticus]